MGRIKSIDNALGINIHVTKEFVNIDGKKTIIGQLTNWIGTRSNINWVMLEMYTINDIASYVFCFSEDEAISIAYGIKFNDADYEISIDYHNMVDEFTGWNYHDSANYNFQTCALCSYMYYEAINVDNVNVVIDSSSNFLISGNVYDIESEELLFYFKATPGINNYNIDYYSYDGKKMDCLEFANLETSKVCGAGNADVDNAIYYVISNAIYNAMIKTLPISILIRACIDANNAHAKNLKIPNAKDYIKSLFADEVIYRFVAEFMMSMIDKDGNIRC